MQANDCSIGRSAATPIFRSFWMGGFEGADHVNTHGQALSMNNATRHWELLDEDYARLVKFGIRTVRESVGWRAASEDTADLQRLQRHARIAQARGVQVIWTLHHYGLPPGVDFLAADFAARFADFCERVARCVLPFTDGPPIFQPVNEISYLSWAVSHGQLMQRGAGTPSVSGGDLKRQLVRAALRACDALWSIAPSARIVHTDPMIHVTGPTGGTEDQRREARQVSQGQFEAFDLLAGRVEPDLGGAPRYLDVIGVNYYHPNQWEHPSNERLHWHLDDPRRRDPADMLQELSERYGRPLFIAETGHIGEGRAQWLEHVAAAVARCEARGVPVEGICLYPVVDRHDWQDPAHWHRCGLWDLPDPAHDPARRELHRPCAERLRHWQTVLPNALQRGHSTSPTPIPPQRKPS
jgi:UDP-galactopyranose mutase